MTKYERALTSIALYIRENPTSSSGVELRKFLYSLYNNNHVTCLWTLTNRVGAQQAKLVMQVIEGAFSHHIQTPDIKRALLVSGDLESLGGQEADENMVYQLAAVGLAVQGMARIMPPGQPHQDLVRILGELEDIQDKWEATLRQPPTNDDRPLTS
jgi:hypothetical protein